MVIQKTPTKIDKIVSLQIGQHQENVATQVKMDVSDWITAHPNAGFHVLFKRPGEVQAQPVLSSLEDGILTWTVGNWETENIGVGYAEVRAIEADTALVAKSRVIPCSVEDSIIEDEGDVPPEFTDWRNQVLSYKDAAETAQGLAEDAQAAAETAQGLAEEAQGLAEDAQAAAETAQAAAETAASSAQTYAQSAKNYRDSATGQASNAMTYALMAVSAKNDAVTAKEQAEAQATAAANSATSASAAQEAAETAQGEAEDAQEAAEAAQGLAEDAQEAAETAQAAAETAQAAAETAQSAAETAQAAAVSAKNDAVTAKGQAEAQATAAASSASTAETHATNAGASATDAAGSATAAEAAQTAAETAQAAAEAAQSGAEGTAEEISGSLEQIAQNASEIDSIDETVNGIHVQDQLYDKTTNNTGGCLRENGTKRSTDAYEYTDYIQLESGFTYQYTGLNVAHTYAYTCFYNSEKTLLTDDSVCMYGESITATHTLTVPAGASFVRFSIYVGGSSTSKDDFKFYKVFNKNGIADAVNQLKTIDTLTGKIALFFGDSICNGSSAQDDKSGYAGRIGTANSMNWYNYGYNGATVAVITGHHSILSDVTTAYQTYTAPDFVILEGGTNDADNLGDAGIGTYTENDYSGTYDTATFTGAFETMLYNAVQQWPHAQIGFVSAHKMGNGNNRAMRRTYFLRAQELCKKWGIPFIDLWIESKLNRDLSAQYNSAMSAAENIANHYLYTDGQHLTPDGYALITPQIEWWMRGI